MLTIGLDPESVGRKSVERAISARMKLTSVDQEAQYLTLLKSSALELETLTESVVVPETWFFRDNEPFAYLREYATRNWKPHKSDKPRRLLSIPCATGEEPFSIAITLIEAGLEEHQFSIDAIDISARALEIARQGNFAQSSFRGKKKDQQSRFFTRTEYGFQIHEQILRLVNFQPGNILDPDFCTGLPCYDVIFCRNLLIYMVPEAKKQILDNLNSALAEGGLFFAGHTETMIIRSYGYSPVEHARAFAFRKKRRNSAKPIQKQTKTLINKTPLVFSVPSTQLGASRSKIRQAPTMHFLEPRSSSVPDDPGSLLDRVRELGNRGALQEAKVVCEEILQKDRLNSEAHYLMGMLQETSDRSDLAEECFQKALYLNPNHYHALVQLYLLYEQREDYAKAEAFRLRASRVQSLPGE
jgi:chemotaxis protein methyltransferase WspC